MTFMAARRLDISRWLLAGCLVLGGQDAPATKPAADPMPHVRVDVENKVVDIDAKVVLREGEWLELLACARGSREHESILVIDAVPRHIHLGLVMIGAEPGAPLMWREKDDEIEIRPAFGPRIGVSIITEEDGRRVETPADQWVINQETKKLLPDNVWLFSGAGFVEYEGKQIYRGDVGGTIISLVNFGDDVLARPTRTTNNDDNAVWRPNTEKIPPVDTDVVIRLKLLPPPAADPAASQPAEDSGGAGGSD